ncbi:MAG TPA: sugar ABC transporter permease [Thermoanaerobaculia bacterium]
MSADPQTPGSDARAPVEEIRRRSGEQPVVPPEPGPDPRTARVNRRVAFAVLLAALAGVTLLHLVLAQRFAAQTADRADRAAMISIRGLEAIAEVHRGEGDALRAAVAQWQKEHPSVRAARVVNLDGRSIEASTFPEDLKEGEIPRRMQRPEKPLYDLGQELRANVDTNVAEGTKREDELRVERRPDGSLLLSAPVEVDGSVIGMVQALGTPEVVAVETPSYLFALAFALAPFVILFALSFAVGEPKVKMLTFIAAALLLFTLFAYRQWAMASLSGGARAAEQRFSERVQREAEVARRVAPGAEATARTWDADVHRVPRKVDPEKAVEGERAAVASATWGIAVLSLLILFFIALGWALRMASALRNNRQAYSFVAPAMVGMLILVFFPFIYGIVLSFTSQNVYSVNKPLTDIWIGLQNYGEILGDFHPFQQTDAGRQANYGNFYYTLLFTVIWTICNVAIGVTLGLVLALILNTKNFRFKTVYRVLLILPWALPNYITALIFKGMFHQQFGAINQTIQLFGGSPIAWFDRPVTSFLAVLTTNGWLSFPFMMVVSLGALQSIPADLYEAARVDGASRWQQFTRITLPSLQPALVPAVILSVVWTFNMFNIIYLVSAGMPAGSTEILITQAYKIAFEQYRYGYAAAYSTIIFAILLIYGVFQNRVSRATESIA